MYETLLSEGHDARLFRFSPSDDETISGGHLDPKNKEFWQVGCLGITAPCSEVINHDFKKIYMKAFTFLDFLIIRIQFSDL